MSKKNDNQTCKWYEWEYDMIELSKELPDILIKLKGIREENGDQWISYFLNGKFYQRYDEFVLNQSEFETKIYPTIQVNIESDTDNDNDSIS